MQQLQQLIDECSFKIEKGMMAYWSNTDRTQELNPDIYVGKLKRDKIFAVGGKVVGYMSQGDMYITPYTKETVQALRNAGYKEYAFFVPLSPKEMSLVDENLAKVWQNILDRVNPTCRPKGAKRVQTISPFAQPAAASAY